MPLGVCAYVRLTSVKVWLNRDCDMPSPPEEGVGLDMLFKFPFLENRYKEKKCRRGGNSCSVNWFQMSGENIRKARLGIK